MARYVDARDRKDAKATEALFTADADQLVSSGEWRKGRDAVVRGTTVFNDPAGDQRPLVDGSLVPALSRVPGVAHAQGTVQGYAQLIGKDGTPVAVPK